MTSFVITQSQIEEMASSMVKVTSWGYEQYIKVDGKFVLDHILIPEPAFKRTHKVYPDNRESEVIAWIV